MNSIKTKYTIKLLFGFALLLILGFIVSPYSYASSASQKSKKVTFTSELMKGNISLKPDAIARRNVLKAFLHKYPNYIVKPFIIPGIYGSSMDSGPLMGIASGNPPQAIRVNFRQSSTYIDHGFLAPLEEILARVLSDNPKVRQTDSKGHWLANPDKAQIKEARKKILSRTPKRMWPVIYRKTSVESEGLPKGKHIWSIPTHFMVRALVYRKDVFQEAGLDPEKPPTTWKQFMQYARQISTLPNTIGFSTNGGANISFAIFNFMASNGVRYVSKNKDGKWHATFDTPKAVQTIYYLLRLGKEPFTINGTKYYSAASYSNGGPVANLKWQRGQIGMKITSLSSDLLSQLNPQLTGIAPMPAPKGGSRAGELNSEMVGIYSHTTPAQKIAIMHYIWFITGEKAKRISTKTMVNYGYGTFVNPVLLKKFGYDDILRKVPKAWRTTFTQALEHGVPEPYGKNTQFIYHAVSKPINWALAEGDNLLKLPKKKALGYIHKHLHDAAQRADQHMLGHLTPKQQKIHHVVGVVGLTTVLVLFFTLIIWILSHQK